MRTRFGNVAREGASRRGAARLLHLIWISAILANTPPAIAQERLLFPAVDNARQPILEKIRNERVRLDMAVWLLGDREITLAIIEKHRSGVPVRVVADRAAIFETDPNTRIEYELLASAGVPIRLRYHPTWFPEIMHWKAAIFVGQGTVEFGSANWTAFELAPFLPTDFKDETVMFTDDPALVRAFLTKFDQMWADTTYFLDWPLAYRTETGQAWTAPMTIPHGRLEPDYPTEVPGMIWSQGPELNNAMAAEIDREHSQVDMVIYRLSDPVITDALLRKHRAGVRVRVFIEPFQYRAPEWPEYWMTAAQVDRLWRAGVPIKQRTHVGLTHMKTLITSHSALNASANFTRRWQRDHNYFIPAQTKPALHAAMRARFDAMWNDPVNYAPFRPLRPDHPSIVWPVESTTRVSATPTLEWRRAPWGVAYDVYLGPSDQELVFQGRVEATMEEDPPQTYTWTPPRMLHPNRMYYWRVVTRTYATDLDPSLVAGSGIGAFFTNPGPPLPAGGVEVNPEAVAPVAVWRPAQGMWHIRTPAGAGQQFQWGTSALNDVPVAGDYDGDGAMDVAVWRPHDGAWYIRTSASAYQDTFTMAWGAGALGDVPVPADYDGDGRADLAVWRPGVGGWYIRMSATAYQTTLAIPWGAGPLGDVPAPGDYDGDRKADLAVWRPSEGTWFVLTSSSGYRQSFTWRWGSGALGDVPVPGDYDGDGRTDPAVWRPNEGVWYIATSASGYRDPFVVRWGAGPLRDVPVPGDYDKDGRADIAVWRPAEGVWYILRSSAGYAAWSTVHWGVGALNDVPVRAGVPLPRR